MCPGSRTLLAVSTEAYTMAFSVADYFILFLPNNRNARCLDHTLDKYCQVTERVCGKRVAFYGLTGNSHGTLMSHRSLFVPIPWSKERHLIVACVG